MIRTVENAVRAAHASAYAATHYTTYFIGRPESPYAQLAHGAAFFSAGNAAALAADAATIERGKR